MDVQSFIDVQIKEQTIVQIKSIESYAKTLMLP
jgi:hypothetical protein